MERKKITAEIDVLSYEELPEKDRHLVDLAKKMTAKSYAPYSRFHVGAAILMDNGEIVCGSNQENAAFSSGTCAERSACFQAGAIYPDVPFRKIAIASWTRLHKAADMPAELCFQNKPISPCGSCRQALLEYEARYGAIEVLLYGLDCIYWIPSVSALMPLSFTEF